MEFDIYRMFFVFISGYFLSVSGSLSQLITNNTMASPSTLGMDGVAVLTIIMAQAFITWIYPEADLSGFSFGLFLFLLMTIGVFIYFRNTSSEKVWHVTSVKKIILLEIGRAHV